MSLPPILMIHGMWSRPSAFATLRQELAAAGQPSVAVTLPHHDLPPGSPPPPALAALGVADYVAAIAAEAARLDEPPVILGHSLGGLLAQHLAARVAHRGLILLATAPSPAAMAVSLDALGVMAAVTGRWGWWREPTLLPAAAARSAVYNGVPEAEAAAAIAELTWDSGRVLREVSLPWLGGAPRLEVARLVEPALVIVGLEDRIVPPAASRRTARLLAGAGARVDYEEWPGVGHWLFHDAVRPRVVAAIARFMVALPQRLAGA